MRVDGITVIDIYKKKKEDKTVYQLLIIHDNGRACELFSTEDECKSRMFEVLKICGHDEISAKRISTDYLPEDKTKEGCDGHLSNLVKKAVIEAIIK